MKRIILIFAALLVCLALFACGGEEVPNETPAPDNSSAPVEEGEPEASAEESTEPEAVPPHEHTFDGKWEQNTYYHWQSCSVCGQTGNGGDHEFTLVMLEKAPTESEDGNGFYACDICGVLEEKVIPAGTVLDNE